MHREKSLGRWAVGAALLAFSPCTTRPDELADDLKLSLWDHTIDFRGAAGYKDNVLLSNVKREASAFWLTAADFSLFRAPLDGGPSVTIFASAEDRRYFSAPDLDNEDVVLSQAKIMQEVGGNWSVGGLAQYLYADQVYDASATEQLFTALPVISHNFEVAPIITRTLPWNSELELKISGERQLFNAPLDSYWEVGPQLTYTKKYGNRSSISLSYRYDHRYYDTRHALDLERFEIPDHLLRFDQHDFELTVNHSFDQARHWRNRVRLLFGMNADNGVGFYDYNRYRIIDRFGYYGKDWQATIEGKILYYDYQKQPVPDGTAIRQLWEYDAGLHLEKTVWKKLKVFADYEYGTVSSNFPLEEYDANTVMGGVDWEF